MNEDQEQKQAILKRVATRERASRIKSLVFTLVPLLVVGTLLALSVRWITTADRAALIAGKEAALYKETLALSEKPSIEMANKILESQRQIADQNEQLKVAAERVVRLEEALQASNQTPDEFKETIRRYEDAIRQKDHQILLAKDAGKAEEAQRSKEALQTLARAKDNEFAEAKARAQREIQSALDRAAKAEKAAQGANELASQLNECKLERVRLNATLGGVQRLLRNCEDTLKNCQPEDAAHWKDKAAKFEEAFNACIKTASQLRERLGKYENNPQ